MKYITIFLLSLFILSGCSLLGADNSQKNQGQNPAVDVRQPDNSADQDTEDSVMEKEPGSVEQSSFTMSEISSHNSREDCWLLIEGKVYDVTEFIAGGKHGGGDAILEGCGKNATELYNTRPMGSGTPHSDKARSFLPNFYIGDFKE